MCGCYNDTTARQATISLQSAAAAAVKAIATTRLPLVTGRATKTLQAAVYSAASVDVL